MKDFIVYSEYEKVGIYSALGRFSDLKDEINLRVKKGEGTDYEFMVKLIEFSAGKLTLKTELFDDAFQAFTDCKEVFEVLARYQDRTDAGAPADIVERLAKDLVKAGWKRKAPAKSEMKRRKPVCPTCGHEGNK